ncbi:hypothetical protein E1287_07200 [Actinomadura sp. KC06]|uniref:hypothetical protein n=1 Tax=Actinomadura sp. KC06 TaxID=2530369 RepID=UPI001051F5A0|nr:hypothetical protein [Actinomadura sp. KC06]TDD37838.1 hypothetical protein E1287_07200 [Actinomadura sp. KC06]
MTSVLTVRVGGSVAGSCGRACYDAEHEPCRCVCCGTNHRAGFEQAVRNARDMAAEWVARARADGQDIDTYELGLDVVQHALF